MSNATKKLWQRTRPLDGAMVWSGESLFDKKPLIVIATNVKGKRAANNSKTGDVIHTWILREDISPYEALKTKGDASICGTCPLRPQGPVGTAKLRACYVHIGMVNNIWEAYHNGRYRNIDEYADPPFAGRVLRIGAYGDPAAVPPFVWRFLIEGAAGWLGYTHEWRARPDLKDLVMASTDAPADLAAADAAGWRSFRTLLKGEAPSNLEVICPASKEARVDRASKAAVNGRGIEETTCQKCGLCTGKQGEDDRRRSIALVAHGYGPAQFAYRKYRAERDQKQLPLLVR